MYLKVTCSQCLARLKPKAKEVSKKLQVSTSGAKQLKGERKKARMVPFTTLFFYLICSLRFFSNPSQPLTFISGFAADNPLAFLPLGFGFVIPDIATFL